MTTPIEKRFTTTSLLIAWFFLPHIFFGCSKTSFSSGEAGAKRTGKVQTGTNANAAGNPDPAGETPEDTEDVSKLETPSPSSSPTPSSSPGNPISTPAAITACVPNITAEMAEPVGSTVTDIHTAADLAAMTDLRRYRLAADIDLTGFWTPILARKRIYLDGNGHSIRGLKVDMTTSPNHIDAGLFAKLSTSSIVNLKIVSPSIKGFYTAGVIAGKLEQSCLENVEISDASISATYEAGTIAGAVEYGGVAIKNAMVSAVLLQGPNAQATAQSIGASGAIGGLFGYLQNGGGGANSISGVSLQFDISADTRVNGGGIGSLIGTNQVPVQITDTTATGTMRCISTTCARGGRYVGYFGPASTYPDPVLQNTVVNLTRTGTWDNFKDN